MPRDILNDSSGVAPGTTITDCVDSQIIQQTGSEGDLRMSIRGYIRVSGSLNRPSCYGLYVGKPCYIYRWRAFRSQGTTQLSTPVPVSGGQPGEDNAESKGTFPYFLGRAGILGQGRKQIAPVLNFQEAPATGMPNLHDASVTKTNVGQYVAECPSRTSFRY